MRHWKVCTCGATDICIHPAILVYMAYAVVTKHGAFIGLAYLSVALHEAAHALTAAAFGYAPRRVELTPLGAVMHLEDDLCMPPLQRFAVVAAGPALTLLLCALALHGASSGWLAREPGRLLFLANTSILLLNLLPVLPLDGGRLLSLLLSQCLPQQRVRFILRLFSSCIGIGLILLNIWCAWQLGSWNLSLAFAGSCMVYAGAMASTTQAMCELRELMDRRIRLERQGSLPACGILCLSSEPLRHLVQTLPARKAAVYLCLKPGSMKLLGCMDEFALVQHYLRHPSEQIGHCFPES